MMPMTAEVTTLTKPHIQPLSHLRTSLKNFMTTLTDAVPSQDFTYGK